MVSAKSQRFNCKHGFGAQRPSAPPVIECRDLTALDFETVREVVVKTAKGSNFRVEQHAQGACTYIVYGRTEFIGGSTVVRGIDAVRDLLARR